MGPSNRKSGPPDEESQFSGQQFRLRGEAESLFWKIRSFLFCAHDASPARSRVDARRRGTTPENVAADSVRQVGLKIKTRRVPGLGSVRLSVSAFFIQVPRFSVFEFLSQSRIVARLELRQVHDDGLPCGIIDPPLKEKNRAGVDFEKELQRPLADIVFLGQMDPQNSHLVARVGPSRFGADPVIGEASVPQTEKEQAENARAYSRQGSPGTSPAAY